MNYKTSLLKTLNAPETRTYKIPQGIATVAVAVYAGLIHDPIGKEGLAHYLEHGIFKGTKPGDSLEIQKRWGMRGLSYNASTGSDVTTYYLTGLSTHLEFMITELNSLLRTAEFPDAEIEREREIILTEALMRADDHDSAVYDTLKTLFYTKGYDRDSIGTVESIKSITAHDMRDFKKQYYVANNMSIHIASNVSDDKVLDMVERVWTAFPIVKGVKTAPRPATVLNDVWKLESQLKFSLDAYSILYEMDQGMEALVLDELTGGTYGILSSKILREKLGAVYTAGMWFMHGTKNKFIWAFMTSFKKERKDEVLQAVHEYFELKTKFTKDEFLTAKNCLLTSFIKNWGSKMAITGIGSYRDDPDYDLNADLKKLKSMTYNQFNKWLKTIKLNGHTVYFEGTKK